MSSDNQPNDDREESMGDAVNGRLMAVVFQNCGLLVNGKPNNMTSAMEEARKAGVTLEMLRGYGASHKFDPAMMEAMEQAFAQ